MKIPIQVAVLRYSISPEMGMMVLSLVEPHLKIVDLDVVFLNLTVRADILILLRPI